MIAIFDKRVSLMQLSD